MALSLLLQLPPVWTAADQRFAIHLFHGYLSLEDMGQLEALGDRWTREHGGKRVELVVVYPSQARMSTEERHRISALIKRWDRDRAASATVILAEGMVGAMQRSVLTGLQLIAGTTHPQKVFSNVADAVNWLMPHVREVNGPSTNGTQLLADVNALCRQFVASRG